MDSWTVPLAILYLVSMVNTTPSGYIGWPHDGAGSLWHVFRQVHASEVAGRQFLSSSRTPSSKVAETTRIIPKEERRSESSFTIISRIKAPFEQLMNMLPPRPSWASGLSGRRAENDGVTSRRTTSLMENPWPRQNVSNLFIIGEAEPVIDDRRHVESSRQNDGFYTIEKGLVRYRSSQKVDNEADGSQTDTHHSYPTLGLWEMLKKRRPQKWDVLNKLLTQPTTEEMPTSTSSLNWNESFSSSQTENDDSVLVTEINSRTQEPTIPSATTTTSIQPPNMTAHWNGSQSQDSGSVHSIEMVTTHRPESRLVVRIDDLTSYSATNTFDNGTLVFQRSPTFRDGLNQSTTLRNLSDVELFYPGFSQIANTRPDRIMVQSVILASMDETFNNVEEESQAVRPPQSIMMGNQSVLIPSTSPWAGNHSGIFSIPSINDTEEVDGKHVDPIDSNFRKIDEIKMDDNSVHPDPLQVALSLAVPAVITNVTALPSSLAEEQMSPPLLKTLENLLLTHLLPPMTSSSSTSVASSSPSTLLSTESINPPPSGELHHSEPALPIVGDWADAWQLVEPVRMSTTSPNSTTALPEAINNSPAYYDPAINEATLSSHSVIIPARSLSPMMQPVPTYPVIRPELIEYPGVFTTDQQSLTAVSEKPPVSSTSSTSTTISSSPIQMFTLRPVSESVGESVVITKPPSKKNSGIASLILAHTAALISGRKLPQSSRSTNQIKLNSSRTLTPVAASVHVIVATPIPDPDQEEALRYRSLDSGVNHKQNPNSTSWSFPSFSQLIETPDLLHTDPVPVERPTNATLVSSLSNNQTAADLPPLPRFTCGQQTTADELVLTNPSYPDPDEHTGRCGFRLLVPSNHVCQVRVEFRDSRMLFPRRGLCLDQFMTVSESTARNHSVVTEKFCGWNSDQHFYLTLSEQSGPTPRHVDFQINTIASGFPYRYSLIIQQIDCQSPTPAKAPVGCFQYFPSSRTGEIKSFNFDGGQYWNKQNYRICIRSVDESCSLALSSTNGDFGLHKASSLKYPADRAGVGARACPRDYLWIPGSVPSEETTEASNTRDRYCGTQFSNQHGDTHSNVVMVRMYSSVHIIEFRAGVPRFYDARLHGPGFRIKFEQLNECPSLPTRNNDEKSSFIPTNQEDYYDEALEQNDDLSIKLLRLPSNDDDIATLF